MSTPRAGASGIVKTVYSSLTRLHRAQASQMQIQVAQLGGVKLSQSRDCGQLFKVFRDLAIAPPLAKARKPWRLFDATETASLLKFPGAKPHGPFSRRKCRSVLDSPG